MSYKQMDNWLVRAGKYRDCIIAESDTGGGRAFYYPSTDKFDFTSLFKGVVSREMLLKMVMESARLGERIEEKEEDEDDVKGWQGLVLSVKEGDTLPTYGDPRGIDAGVSNILRMGEELRELEEEIKP